VDRQAITRAIADQSRTIRIPVHNESMNKFLRATRELEKELGRAPTNEEISRRMDIPVEKVQKLKTISRDRSRSKPLWGVMVNLPSAISLKTAGSARPSTPSSTPTFATKRQTS